MVTIKPHGHARFDEEYGRVFGKVDKKVMEYEEEKQALESTLAEINECLRQLRRLDNDGHVYYELEMTRRRAAREEDPDRVEALKEDQRLILEHVLEVLGSYE